METFRFQSFPVYRDARKFRTFVRKLLRKFPSSEKYVLADQINRSCSSIVLNIAEGSAEKSDRNFARFLRMSISSVSETVAAFDLAHDDDIVTPEELERVHREATSIAKQLGGFIKTLSGIKR